MNKSQYFSFLICNHPEKIDLYYNGLQIDYIKDNQFIIHKFKNIDGTER